MVGRTSVLSDLRISYTRKNIRSSIRVCAALRNAFKPHSANLSTPAPMATFAGRCAGSSTGHSVPYVVAQAGRGHAGEVSFSGRGGSGAADFSQAAPAQSLWKMDGATLQRKLAATGLAGLAAYGIFNSLYYVAAFLIVWFGVLTVPRGQGIVVAAAQCAKALAVIWAGSQVTKVPRAAAALLASPAVDMLLGALRDRLKLPSKKEAFAYVIVPACFTLFALAMGGCVLCWM